MTKCELCDSTNIRMKVPGFLRNELLCNKCGHTFFKLSPSVVSTALMTTFGVIGIDLLDGELGEDIEFDTEI